MAKLVECVPNFSEGRDKSVIDAIARAVEGVSGVTLLDVDPGADTNRTVFTFVGRPEVIVDAAYAAIAKGVELIDMSQHRGAHARQGACDVCPFIPIGETTMEECVALARELGRRVGEGLGVPVYLYEYAATKPEWKTLQAIRIGEYEALAQKATQPEWAPDYGPHKFNARAGATVIGARDFLIAYNINLNTRNKKLAKAIAERIRDSGRLARDEAGKKIIGEDGKALRIPGMFDYCKATGWYIDTYGRTQVTMNLTNYRVTPPHVVFDEVCEIAAELGLRVTGSEIVGLVPLAVMMDAGLHYLSKQGSTRGLTAMEVVETAVQSMGLGDVAPFEPRQKIIEWRVAQGRDVLMSMTCNEFCDELSRDSPAPGGGSVAAFCGSLSAALSAMVAALTHTKKGYEAVRDQMDEIGVAGQRLKEFFAQAVDDDSRAFDGLMEAMKMPKKSPEEKAARVAAMQEATKQAISVPLAVLGRSAEGAELASRAARLGNSNSVSDAGVAALCAGLCAKGAYYNVLINLEGITDSIYREETMAKADEALARTEKTCAEVEGFMLQRLRGALDKAAE